MNLRTMTLAAGAAAVLSLAGQAGAQSIEFGQSLFQNNCAACHGPEARGDGPLAVHMEPKPANLRQLSARNDGVYPFGAVWDSIASGSLSAHGTSLMPVWGDVFMAEAMHRDIHPGMSAQHMVEARMLALTYYIQTLQE